MSYASLLSSFALVLLVGAPTAASAAEEEEEDEPPTSEVARETAKPTPVSPVRAGIAFDASTEGLGVAVGLRYRYVEGFAGASTYLFRSTASVGAKVFLFPDADFTPYAYGRIGEWDESLEFMGSRKPQGGHLTSFGLGMDSQLGPHMFTYAHIGLDQLHHWRPDEYSEPISVHYVLDLHFGLGARF